MARIFIGYTDERTAIFGCQGSSMAFGSQEHLLPLMNGRPPRMWHSPATMGQISVFYSYSHRDEVFRQELEAHLSFLRRGNLIAEWHDRKIDAGDEWKAQIDRHIGTADIVLLLVSADFIASDYCWGEEMTKALARHEREEARVIPVILRPAGGRARRSESCRQCQRTPNLSVNGPIGTLRSTTLPQRSSVPSRS